MRQLGQVVSTSCFLFACFSITGNFNATLCVTMASNLSGVTFLIDTLAASTEYEWRIRNLKTEVVHKYGQMVLILLPRQENVTRV